MGERVRGRAGQKMRQRRLRRTNGLCEMCLAGGQTEIATRVDHIKPLALGGEDIDDNTRNLCEHHHHAVTIEQFGFATTSHRRGVDRAGRPIDPAHPWSRAKG